MAKNNTALDHVLAGREPRSDLFNSQESNFQPRGTLRPSESGRFERRTIQTPADHTLKHARRKLVEYLESMGWQHGWTDRTWQSYRRLAKMDYDYNTPPSEQFQSFANSVLEAARVSSVALGVRVNENTIGTQSETLSGA